ncbi:MAG: hypothetical protein CTY33_03025 [Methylotenera sp.]|nr:MAG: hypothetical protein CTY33_03025 [Methylotenera sp.]
MNKTQKSIALALGGAFALSMAAPSVSAAENPFAIKTLSSGYQVAEHHEEKMKDGKCGTGKCGAEKKAGEAKCSADKMKEGTCSADKAKDGSCSADKMKEGSCSADKK